MCHPRCISSSVPGNTFFLHIARLPDFVSHDCIKLCTQFTVSTPLKKNNNKMQNNWMWWIKCFIFYKLLNNEAGGHIIKLNQICSDSRDSTTRLLMQQYIANILAIIGY